LKKDAEGAERGRKGTEKLFTTKTQRTRNFGLGKFLFPELRALCVLVVKSFPLCPSLPLRLVEQLEKDAEGAEREGRTQRKLFYHKDTEDTEFRIEKIFISGTPCSLCLGGKNNSSVPSSSPLRTPNSGWITFMGSCSLCA
jgi:hypothetical protein